MRLVPRTLQRLRSRSIPEVMPGGVLRVPLQATDPDGDEVTFSLKIDGALPTGQLTGAGELVFQPTPDQIGSYPFSVIAGDGALATAQDVTLNVVSDPVTTTRVSGVIQNVDQEPLVGVGVEIGDLTTLTDASGAFTLETDGDLPSDTLKVRGETIGGEDIYPFIAEKLPLVLGHEVFANMNNVIERPIYLPVLDVANGQPIDPTQETVVTTPNIERAAVTVAAGSLRDEQGEDFDGILSITEVPTELTPAALPPNLNPDVVVTIQPGEMVFETPAALSLPNLSEYAPGVELDLWSINPATGDFDKVGVGRVSADGSVIETVEGGIRNSSWHFFSLFAQLGLEPNGNPLNEKPGCNQCKSSKRLNSSVESHSGALIETHELVSYKSQGLDRNWTLTYDSLRADPRHIVYLGYDDIDPRAITNAPNRLKLVAKLTVNQGKFEYQVPGYEGSDFGLTGGEHIWSIPSQGGAVDAALQVDLRGVTSGRYNYDLVLCQT